MKYSIILAMLLIVIPISFMMGCINTEKEIAITFGEPIFATKTSDDYYMWTIDVYPDEKLYEVKVDVTTEGCTGSYLGSNVISLAHPVVEHKYNYEISFTLKFICDDEQYSQDYTLKCAV